MKLPVITLLTDFGTVDHYVAAMKGVMLGICPEARLIDVTHEIRAFQIAEAAFTLSQTWRYFPAETVHLIVVDPGVGSSRRALVAEADGHRFVAPDNGVLTMVRSAAASFRAWSIEDARFFRRPVSRTFHGRDIFSPVAAHVAVGTPLSEFGPEVQDPVLLAETEPVEVEPGVWSGTILHIDRFGNAVTSFGCNRFHGLAEHPFEALCGTGRIARYYHDYTSAKPGEIFLINGSSGFVEVSMNQADAAAMLGLSAGSSVRLSLMHGERLVRTGTEG
jgi:S-adenosylmethionine hydrolase